MGKVCIGLLAAAVLLAQSPEAGRIERSGVQSVVIVDGPRPVDAAAMTLAERFGIRINVEDPEYLYTEDMRDVTAEMTRTRVPGRRVLIPKGGRLDIWFANKADGTPADVGELVQEIARQANLHFPFGFRVEQIDGWYTLTPTQSRDARGAVVATIPLMDRKVTIRRGERTVAESAKLMADELSRQTGKRVTCCQSAIGGYPWGMTKAAFEAKEEPARRVLERLIAMELQGRPNPWRWVERCDPMPGGWCFIELGIVPRHD